MNRVVLSSDRNPDYAFFAPLSCLLWKRHGYKALLFIVGTAAEWRADPRLRASLERSREVGAEIHFIPTFDGVRTSTVAQCVRMFGAAVPLAEDDYLLTSDIDMFPLGPWVGGNRNPEKDLQIYYANAYHEGVPHYPMCYIGATVKTWRNVVACDPGSYAFVIINALANVLKNAPKDTAGAWSYDEYVLSRLISQWTGFPDRVQLIDRTFVEGEWRLDRSMPAKIWAEVPALTGIADAHLPRPGFTDEGWAQIRPVLNLALPRELMSWCDDYREQWQ